jgi:hypothetical protein
MIMNFWRIPTERISVRRCVIKFKERRTVLQKDNFKLKNKEMQFSLKTVEAKIYSPVRDSHNRIPYADCVPRELGTESSESQFFTKMVPCTPCTWG